MRKIGAFDKYPDPGNEEPSITLLIYDYHLFIMLKTYISLDSLSRRHSRQAFHLTLIKLSGVLFNTTNAIRMPGLWRRFSKT
jgi:hypothetical protein